MEKQIAAAINDMYKYVIVIHADKDYNNLLLKDESYKKIAEIPFKEVDYKLWIKGRVDKNLAESVRIWSEAKPDDIVTVYSRDNTIFVSDKTYELIHTGSFIFESIDFE